MKVAWLLGELRYLPSRLVGHMPAADSTSAVHDNAHRGRHARPARRYAARGDHGIGRTAAPRASGPAAIRQPRGVRGLRRSRPREAVHERARSADRPPRRTLAGPGACDACAVASRGAQVRPVLARDQTDGSICHLAAVAGGSPARRTRCGRPAPFPAALAIGPRHHRRTRTRAARRRANSPGDRHADTRRDDSTRAA